MASKGWWLGRAPVVLLWFIGMVIVAMLVHSQKKNRVDDFAVDKEEEDISATLESSAFADELYHELNEPYRSYPCMPRRIHLSQASNVEKENINMTVSFSLDYNNCRDNVVPSVIYGRGVAVEGRVRATAGDRKQFSFASAKTGENYESDWIYHVMLPKLRGGNQRYWYRIQVTDETHSKSTTSTSRHLKGSHQSSSPVVLQKQDEEDEGTTVVATTPTMTFQTPPLPGSPTTVALLGDLGQTFNSTLTMMHMYKAALLPDHPISMVMCAGDMSYADGEPRRWTNWLDLMEPLFQTTPLHVAAGNHEIECDNITHNIFVPYENWFHMPNRIGPAKTKPVSDEYRRSLWNHDCTGPSDFQGAYDYGNAYYAFDHGLIHMIILSSYSDTSKRSVQYGWLEQELQSVDRSHTPWIAVVFHAPLYNTFTTHVNETEALRMKESMEPLFVTHKVNLIVCGHDHAYMRTHPLNANGDVVKSGLGPVHLTVGAGGNREHHAAGYQHAKPEEWVAKRDRFEYGYGHLHVPNATHAQWIWVRDGSSTKGIQDHVWFHNPNGGQ